jgi:hypothetical protein
VAWLIRAGLLIRAEEPILVGLRIRVVQLILVGLLIRAEEPILAESQILEVIASREMMPPRILAVPLVRVQMLAKRRTVLVLIGQRARPISSRTPVAQSVQGLIAERISGTRLSGNDYGLARLGIFLLSLRGD